jgi:hypothetical protein
MKLSKCVYRVKRVKVNTAKKLALEEARETILKIKALDWSWSDLGWNKDTREEFNRMKYERRFM